MNGAEHSPRDGAPRPRGGYSYDHRPLTVSRRFGALMPSCWPESSRWSSPSPGYPAVYNIYEFGGANTTTASNGYAVDHHPTVGAIMQTPNSAERQSVDLGFDEGSAPGGEYAIAGEQHGQAENDQHRGGDHHPRPRRRSPGPRGAGGLGRSGIDLLGQKLCPMLR